MKPLLRLFKAVVINPEDHGKTVPRIWERTLRNGFILSPELFHSYSEEQLSNLVEVIIEEIGINPEQMNSSFHKSWGKVRSASIEQLVIEQLLHYFTTYGFERMGIYNKDSVYIPNEVLEIPDSVIDGISITVIHGYTKDKIKEKLLELLKSGIALHEDTVKDVVSVAKFVGIGQEDIGSIKNKEVKTALCDYLGLYPQDPAEFLRYIIYKATGRTLLIKDRTTIEGIGETSSWIDIFHLFERYDKEYGLNRLAEVFFRFKPIFLAFKTEKAMKPIVNRIRKLADKHHKPMKKDYLNEVTSMIKSGKSLNISELDGYLKKANPFRKIRLAYALQYRCISADSILYKVRNGKGFATDFSFENKSAAKEALHTVLYSLIGDIIDKVDGKKICIPDYINYTIPATEKQFTGYFPSGTSIVVPKDMIAGIHWNNVGSRRIDLDLSLISLEAGKIGWDASYRTGDRKVLFSGDITDACRKGGATELFYTSKQPKQEFIMLVNYFNYIEGVDVPFDIIVAKGKAHNFDRNYMIDPANVVATTKSKMTEKQKMLGLLVATPDECRFYFAETSIGKSITSKLGTGYVQSTLKYLSSFYQNAITLNRLLEESGAIITEDRDKCDIDLSPGSLEKDTITKLFM